MASLMDTRVLSSEHWFEQATLMVQESELVEQEKSWRILEGLRGPALKVVTSLCLSKKGATVEEFWIVYLS